MSGFYTFASKHPVLASLFVLMTARATVRVAEVVSKNLKRKD